jgi:hypothetical protein
VSICFKKEKNYETFGQIQSKAENFSSQFFQCSKTLAIQSNKIEQRIRKIFF